MFRGALKASQAGDDYSGSAPGLFAALGQEDAAFGTLQVAAYTERANQMFQVAALLKQYALRYNLTVVTTNQVWLASQSCSWSWSQLVASPCLLMPMSQAALYAACSGT